MSGKKKPQTKRETVVHCTIQLCNCYRMGMSTIHTRRKILPEGRTLNHSTVRCRAAAELPRCQPHGCCLSGRTHLLIPARGRAQQRAGLPAVSCKTGTETAELFSQPRTYLFVCTLLWACNINSCSLPHRKTGDWLFNQIKGPSCI